MPPKLKHTTTAIVLLTLCSLPRLIRDVRTANFNKHLWLGITDIEVEGTWKMDDSNEVFDFNGAMFTWSEGNPDNYGGNENCAHIWTDHADTINDIGCDHVDNAYGLCEIEAEHCKP